MAFRLLDQKPQYRTSAGALAAGGRILFYVTGTTTAKNVYPTRADAAALTNSLGSTIALDSDARHSEDVFLASDVAYRVDVQDSDNVSIPGYPIDDVTDAIAGGVTVLDPATGTDLDVYSTDGTAGGEYWRSVNEVPDGTGHSGEVLYSDGTASGQYYAALPTADTYTSTNLPGGISATASASGSVVIGAVRLQWGTDTAPTASALSTSKAVTFGTAFSAAPYYIGIEPAISGGVTSNSPPGVPCTRYSSPTTTGFTAGFFVGEENNGGTDTITSTIPFTWFAVGPA